MAEQRTARHWVGGAWAESLTNDSNYGLSAYIWTRDADGPIRVSRQLDAGFISINGWASLQMKFEEGGLKSSGIGRLGGVASIDGFMETRQITQDFVPLRSA